MSIAMKRGFPTMLVKSPKKLIEVALPLDIINTACIREKSIRHGHPSTLHLWWARRPLAAARAVIFSQMVNDPSWKWEMEHPGEIPPSNLKASWAASRKRLFKIIEDLVLWENTTKEEYLEPARAQIRKSWIEVCDLNKEHPQAAELFNPKKIPAFHGPFAGGGAIPMEAQRLGLSSYASDLNPVAVMINKAMVEIPPKFAGCILFLAPDHGALSRLRDCIKTALAWGTIVDDIAAMRLVLDNLQIQQAKRELQTAEDVLPRVARECYKWFLCPVQHTPTDPKPTVEAFPLNTGGQSLVGEIELVSVENELVITTWSPIHLRTKLKELYWKADRTSINALTFWEDTLKYLYLPRLKKQNVLEQAIKSGAASRDFFGTAYSQYEGKFEGFKLGDANIQLDDTLLLIELETAKKYEADLAAQAVPVVEPVTPGTAEQGATHFETNPGTGGINPLVLPTPAPVVIPKSKTFIGTVDVNAATARMRLVEIAEEIICVLAGDPLATVKVSVEISADYPEGVSDQIKRAVSENAVSLGFRNKSWE